MTTTDPAERLRKWMRVEGGEADLDAALADARREGALAERERVVKIIQEAHRLAILDAEADHTPSGRPKINHRNTDDLFEMVPDAEADR